MTQRFALIVFDWDGTLADSTTLIVEGMQRAIAALGLAPRGAEEIRSLIGIGFRDGLAQLYPERDPAALEAELIALRRASGDPGSMRAPLYEGVDRQLVRLRDAGHRLAVATGKSRAGLDAALAQHDWLRASLAATRTADETANKPDPMMLHELLAQTGVPAARALMVGDTDYDMEMAAAAGICGVAVAGGAQSAARLAASPARAVLDGIGALEAWMQQTITSDTSRS